MASFADNRKSIIKYYGGKTVQDYMSKIRRVLKCAKQENNATTIYDLFGGGAHLALNVTEDFDTVIYNEYSKFIYEFFHVLKDDNKKYDLIETLNHIEPNKENFEIARMLLDNEERVDELGLTDIQKACVTFIITSMSFHANMQRFDLKFLDNARNELKKSIADLERASDMLKNIELFQGDYWEIMKEHLEDKDAVFVLDPPYVKETRTANADNYAIDDFDHVKFMSRCNQCKVPIIICGYNNDLYDRELTQKGWKCISMGQFNVGDKQGEEHRGEKSQKEEFIWTLNFNAPDEV